MRNTRVNYRQLLLQVAWGMAYAVLGFAVGKLTTDTNVLSPHTDNSITSNAIAPGSNSLAAITLPSGLAGANAPLSSSSTSLSSPSTKPLVVQSIFRLLGMDMTAEQIWDTLLAQVQNTGEKVAVEVGCYDGLQCKAAANRGFKKVICVEASPLNFPKTEVTVKDIPNVKLLWAAATNVHNSTIQFHATSGGGSGDHAGPRNPNEVVPYGEPYNVTTVALDNLLDEYSDVYLIKIDTQGHDGVVMSGLERTMKAKRVQFVMIELWPKAMKNSGRTCEDTLNAAIALGYSAYETKLNWLDRPANAEEIVGRWKIHGAEVEDFCKFYMDNSAGFGLWTDILFVRN